MSKFTTTLHTTRYSIQTSMDNGYRHGRSTQTALLTMYDRWVKAAVSEQVSVLLDLSAAFDLVDPNLLISKLEIYGVDRDGI